MPFKDYLRYTVFITPLALILVICVQTGFFTYLDRSILTTLSLNELIASCFQSIPTTALAVMGGGIIVAIPKLLLLKFKKLSGWSDRHPIWFVMILFTPLLVGGFFFFYMISRGYYFAFLMAGLTVSYIALVAMWLALTTEISEHIGAILVPLPLTILLLFLFGYSAAHIEIWALLRSERTADIEMYDGTVLKAHPLRLFSQKSIFITTGGTVVLQNKDIRKISITNSGKTFCGSKHCLKNAWGK